MGWSQQSAMAVEYPHGSPRHPKQPPKIMAGDPFLDDLPSKPPCWGISPFAKHPNYCRSACTRRQKTQGTRKRQDLRSCNQLLVAGQINCYQLLSNIQWIPNEYPMNIQWPSLFLGTDSYDSFTLCQIWWLFGSHQPFVRLGGRNNLRMTSRVQMYKCSLCVYSILIHL